jgi:hypothetical protein
MSLIRETRRSEGLVRRVHIEKLPRGLDPNLSHRGLAYRNTAMFPKIVSQKPTLRFRDSDLSHM